MDSDTLSSLAIISACAVLAPVLAELLRRFRLPSVVIEIGLGILVGPAVLALTKPDDIVEAFANLGLAFLMFLAGYETDFGRIKGAPLARATFGWLISLALGFALAHLLVFEGLGLDTMVIGLALTTTALGTLLPMLRDAGMLTTRFGSFVQAVGTLGEFGPIVAIAVLLSSDQPFQTAVLLVVFMVVAVGAVFVATRPQPPKVVDVLGRNLHSSAQLPVRVSMLLIIVLIWIASELGQDVLLGAFAAGIVVRLFSAGPIEEVIRVKLEAIGFGFLIPVFFVVSGMNFDVDALVDEPAMLIRLPLFLGCFLLVRGIPALLLYRRHLSTTERRSLAFFSAAALPLVVVITTLGVESGRMVPGNAAALVGAGMLSVLIYPLIGFGLQRRAAQQTTHAE